MLLAIVGVMNSGTVTSTTPTTSTPTVASTNPGSCGTSPIEDATLRVSWTIANPDPANYSAKVYENGILQLTQDTAASMSMNKVIAGAVESGPLSPWFSDWTYRVDVVSKATGVVVSSQTGTPWVQQYGGCGGGGGGGDGT